MAESQAITTILHYAGRRVKYAKGGVPAGKPLYAYREADGTEITFGTRLNRDSVRIGHACEVETPEEGRYRYIGPRPDLPASEHADVWVAQDMATMVTLADYARARKAPDSEVEKAILVLAEAMSGMRSYTERAAFWRAVEQKVGHG